MGSLNPKLGVNRSLPTDDRHGTTGRLVRPSLSQRPIGDKRSASKPPGHLQYSIPTCGNLILLPVGESPTRPLKGARSQQTSTQPLTSNTTRGEACAL